MSLNSFVLNKKEIKEFLKALEENNITLMESSLQNELYRIVNDKIHLIIYNTGTIVFKESEVMKIVVDQYKNKIIQLYKGFDYYIGSDETGKGEWYGPLVTVAVCLEPQNIVELKLSGLKDSKKLNKDQIYGFFNIIGSSIIRNSVVLRPETLYKKWQDFSNEGKNYNDILAWTHSRVLFDILDTIDTENNKIRVVIDKFDYLKLDNRLKKYKQNKNIKIIQKVRGESETEVAVASIIAKKVFEDEIKDYLNNFNIDVKNKTLDIVPSEILPKIAKMFFRNVQKRNFESLIEDKLKNLLKYLPDLKLLDESKSIIEIIKSLKMKFEDDPDINKLDAILELYNEDTEGSELDLEKIKEYEHLIQEKEKLIKNLEKKVDKIKGSQLEIDTRIMFEKNLFIKMKHDRCFFNTNENEREILFEEKCIKDLSTKSVEIDLFGKKKENGNKIYCLGECKNISKKMKIKDFKCFMMKASIIAKYKIEKSERFRIKRQKLPSFELLLVSLNGFDFDYKSIDLYKFWSLDKKRIKRFNFLEGQDLLDNFKKANISLIPYKI